MHTFGEHLYLIVFAVRPFSKMKDHFSSHYIEVHVGQALSSVN